MGNEREWTWAGENGWWGAGTAGDRGGAGGRPQLSSPRGARGPKPTTGAELRAWGHRVHPVAAVIGVAIACHTARVGSTRAGHNVELKRAHSERVTIEERVAAEVVGEPSAQFCRLFEHHVFLARLHFRVVEGIRLR